MGTLATDRGRHLTSSMSLLWMTTFSFYFQMNSFVFTFNDYKNFYKKNKQIALRDTLTFSLVLLRIELNSPDVLRIVPERT